jgi:hypothetical protein
VAIDWDALVLAPVMSVFGETVIYTSVSGAQITLTDAVYDANYSHTDVDEDGVAVISSFPALGVRTAEVSPQQGDRLKVVRTGEVLAVAAVYPDSHGHALLRLEQADPS